RPSEHGHWNLFYYDPQGSPFAWLRGLRHFPPKLVNHRVSQKLIKEAGKRLFHMGPQFECYVQPTLMPWFNWVERRSIYEPGGISGAPSIFDRLLESGISYRAYSYHHWNDREILERAQNDLEHSEAEFFFIYLCELDRELHGFWTHPERLHSLLAEYEAKLQGLFETALRLDPKASLAVFSDHGMAPVTSRFDLKKEIDGLGWKMPQDYLAVYDSTMARFWFSNEKSRATINACLQKQQCGRVLEDRELEALGVYFPDCRYGETIFLLNSGWMFFNSDFHSGNWLPAAMHGYHPDDPYSDAVFLSNQKPTSRLRTICEIYDFMESAAGLRAADGHLSHIPA
ncbi:MAG: alkaline phosphatase family protein, partial [Acidobacteria bacterium]|nr:alkaline phosphatase family protein [Acidobacteriota bacterium]